MLCTDQQAAEILQRLGLSGPFSLHAVKQHNHVYRVEAAGEAFFLKTYTKSWYGGDPAATGFCVEHEVRAWAVLARHGLATPGVVLASRGCDNPLGRPFIVTWQLPGRPLTALLRGAARAAFYRLLETTGDYLRRMHAIAFQYPGYIAYDGPSAPLDEGCWQHPIWSARGTRREALDVLEADRPRLPPDLIAQLEAAFAGMEEALAPAFTPPRFTHGDCHAHQFFLAPGDGGWRVTGVLDMEVASAGDSLNDLVKLGIEMAAAFPGASRWWEPLFAGYGGAPDFDLYRLRLLGRHEIEFKCHGEAKWPADRETTLRRMLAARDWPALFAK